MTETGIAATPAPGTGVRTGWGAARRRAKAARDQEFTAFVESTGTRLRRSAYLMCRDWHLAQDLTQQTFTRMYAAWERIRDGTNLEAYSRRVLMNAVFDQQRRRSGSEIVLADPPEPPDPARAGTPELRIALVDALARLSVEDRAVLVLRHAEDHSVDTVAAILGLSVSAVKMRNTRALSRLRDLLGDDFPDP
ncbi:putative RNA polymerase ECF-subfamily sigma factor [Actinoplanes missouriensis 431]|uniref:Putative RNA polymerase ECF-subfamily sigma factor n=1 Tax=Actinoplanes missouriensis (strain ATCC 14538 / DSM 43046 / CBS 188.64 / JCM 3121 / NBRC 102363 / NCIMB 12654 / NRRL B-3342 / UNCC 431) TaxID=512565 RepID=I0HDQ9_ACTM4|nr:SigE family RNA polymerase sigma factor [Actinoplanes missouriensis]BAL91146.1 putative RNA polymerase ECF-subfamily sigma factor [Actinoplanes missouriensis 431]